MAGAGARRRSHAAGPRAGTELTGGLGLWHYANVPCAHNFMRLRLSGMTVGLAAGITIAVAAAFGGATYVYSLHHFQAVIDTASTAALAEGELIRAALEHQMMENDRSLIARMIESFGKEPGVERVVLLDRAGVERYSSVPAGQDGDLKPGSPTCQACHQYPPARRGSSRVIETRGGTVLRTVVPFRNRDACHRCHDASRRINGILILDIDVSAVRAEMTRDNRWMVGGAGLFTLLLATAIALVVRFVVIGRLRRFETAARQIAAGDLDRRVPEGGSDTIAWLAREFNAMADSVTGLVGEVRRQREQLETIINAIDDGIAVLDPERRIVAANDAFLRRAGRARPETVGCSCHHGAPGMCSSRHCVTHACLVSGERQVQICERQAAGGVTCWEEVHASPIRGPAGDVVLVVEVWRDISDRRAAEARLAESHRLASLGLLASGFSHELNTPLATVLTCVEGILREATLTPDAAPDLSAVADSATIARDQVLRCRSITQHFLRLSRGQSSPGDIVDLGVVAAAAARLIAPTARAHHVTIDVAEAPAPIRVRADEAELQHALTNLMLNAIQACRPGGRVRVRPNPGDPVRLTVEDEGCGIAPENLKRIFEPFCSLRQGGTGLGLFLSLNFVRRWGGDILVTSTPGAGSTFAITLPPLPGTASPDAAS
jgi:two-component system, NtrC family, sensor kinase